MNFNFLKRKSNTLSCVLFRCAEKTQILKITVGPATTALTATARHHAELGHLPHASRPRACSVGW
jgi:hypothetical protein